MTGGEVLVRSLAAHGVDTVFGIPGTHSLEIYRHLTRYGIRHVTPRHEQGAGYAADGYARTTGRPGVALTTTGPALLNIATAVGQAYSDSVPVLVISPGPPMAHRQRGEGRLHEMRDQRAAMAAVARLSHRVTSHAELTEAVAQAYLDFAAERPRPVHLEIPLDLLTAEADISIVDPLPVTRRQADPSVLAEARARLSTAKRPGILLGGGARAAGAEALAIGAPILTTANGKGTVPENHPLSLGAALHLPAASAFIESRDVLLAVGTEFAETDWWNGPPPRPGYLIRVDIDPAQLLINARPDLAIAADAKSTLAQLVATGAVEERWRERIRAEAREEGRPWLSMMDAIRRALDESAVVTADTAMACYYGALGNLPVYVPGGFCYPTGFGTLGYALPAAIGAAVGSPYRQVIALTGDGGLMFSVQEFAMAAAEGVTLPVVVFANGGYGEIRTEMNAAGIEPIAVDLPEPDLPALANALGGKGVRVASPDHLEQEVAAARERTGPTLLVVSTREG